MAIFTPNLETVAQLHQKPTSGEWHLLQFLKGTLDDSYQVFFQPFLNGDMPDIIIMREGSGVYIIEVKDWNLNKYSIGPKLKWHLKSNEKALKSV